jgi:hypothetical protein
MGSLSMTAYIVGCDDTIQVRDTHAAPPLPQVPPDETNV